MARRPLPALTRRCRPAGFPIVRNLLGRAWDIQIGLPPGTAYAGPGRRDDTGLVLASGGKARHEIDRIKATRILLSRVPETRCGAVVVGIGFKITEARL